VFLLNNDATVTEDTLGSLYLASKALSDSAALGSVVRYRDSGALQFFGSRTSPVSGGPNWFSIPADASQLNAEIIETDFVIGAAFFVPMSVLDKVGNFDERFYLNYEEVDWCYRARRLGVPSFVVTRSVVFHEGSASLGDWHAPMQTYFHARNRLLFYDKHTSIWQRIRGFTQVIWRGFKEVVWYAACRMNLKRSPNPTYELNPSTHALLLAIRDYMLRRFGDCPQVVRDLARKHRRAST
jgi:GT2 family glycosyltransferase